ncbi:MAG: lectin [Roseivirga sp.]|nr:lectin [Roseivirga sp.]
MDRLLPGQLLERGKQLKSQNGKYRLILQDDGNLVLYNSEGYLWATNTAGRAAKECVMQEDGNCVLYGYNDREVLWASNTAGKNGAYLIVQDDGNVVIYQPVAVWATNTNS